MKAYIETVNNELIGDINISDTDIWNESYIKTILDNIGFEYNSIEICNNPIGSHSTSHRLVFADSIESVRVSKIIYFNLY